QFEKGVREITSFHRARSIDCNPYRAIKINQSVARERRYHWPHRAERRSVESKSEITGLILRKAERPGACHLQAGSPDENGVRCEKSVFEARDDHARIDLHVAHERGVEIQPQRAFARHASEL